MNFAKDIQQFYKYKACRIAFNRWKNYRGAVMPEPVKEEEPGTNDQSDEEEQDENEDNSNLNESEDEEEESD
eukprot:CAMPEP_0201596488 /NCGR_PEP_ID=MMETSP0190_2-20130828/193165_1 /ASSEMBLY_ACC=CAM_ASM_000263 /TAXON_ID=37353 /ORGANISM="Rosalina sp." /LENGTH=71 /DNA_ID=CAMNT_0048056869 /DNA_START=604 /DNA_END=819 /DNA_ORIENTATION=+